MSYFDDEDLDGDFYGGSFKDANDKWQSDFEANASKQDQPETSHPLMDCAQEMLYLIDFFLAYLEEDSERDMYGFLLDDAQMIISKIGESLQTDSWLIRMDLASVMRRSAESIFYATNELKHSTTADQKYVDLLKNEIYQFRSLFREWVQEIHDLKDDGLRDNWGLFNRY